MANITKLNVMLTASTKGLSLGINKAQGMLNSLSRSASRMKRNLSKSFNGLGTITGTAFKSVGIAAVAAGTSLAYFTKKSIDAISDTNDFAKSLGLSYDQLRAIQFAAGQAGVSSEQLNGAFSKMADTLGTAFGGDKGAIEKFESIGLSIKDLQRMNPAQQFAAIAAAINKIQDPSVKMAAARDVFGKSGGVLISLFENAGAAINESANALAKFGITGIDVDTIDRAGDAIGTLGLYAEGAGNQLANYFSPYIIAAVAELDKWTTAAGGVGPAMDTLITGAIDKMDQLLNKISAAKDAYNSFASNVQGGVGWVADKAADVAEATGVSAAWQADMQERRITKGIAPAHQAEARALIKERGGFEREGISARRISNEMNISSRQSAGAVAGAGGGLGTQLKDWRTSVDAPPVAAMTPGGRAPREDPAIQVLRNIEANTGKNKIAFAG